MERVRRTIGAIALTLLACGGNKAPPPEAPSRPVPERLASNSQSASKDSDPGNNLGATRRVQRRKSSLPPPPTLIASVAPSKGFVDTPIAFDASGDHLLYVNGDAADMAQLVEFDPANNREVVRIDISKFTRLPMEVAEVRDGQQYWIRGRVSTGDERHIAAVVDSKGKVLRKWGPATNVERSTYQGEPIVVAYQRSEQTDKENRPVIIHTVEAFSISTGKRIGRPGRLQTDLLGHSKDLDFRVNHWRHAYRTAVGIKGGEYDPKEDQRTPNVEGWYDLVGHAFERTIPIADLLAHAARFQDLEGHDNEYFFVSVARDLSGLVAFENGVGPRAVELPEPLHYYFHQSLVVQHPTEPTQPLYFSFEVDPVNPDAVARKRADEKFLDVYRLASGASVAVRVARLPLDERTSLRWRARSGVLVAGPRHIGFSRGGPKLDWYQMTGDSPTVETPPP